ncbi:MAG TPA: MFS transporter [Terriglobales bacterium]|nr:MFS transporter [Terriglobales bacterium]
MAPTSDNTRWTPGFSRVLVLLALSIFINYIDRSNLSIAAPLIKDELGISASQLGILLSAFFWTYSCCQLLSGWLVDHFDVKWVFAAGFFLWSSATAVTGVVHSLVLLLVVRVVLGLGESVAYPSYSKIMAVHCPEGRRGFANSMIAAGLALGPSFGMLLGGSLVALYGWRPFFVALGLVCLLWLVPWVRWMPTTDMASSPNQRKGPGTREILRQRSAWGTCICLFCVNYYLYFMVTWLPFYLVRERHYSMGEMAKIGGSVFLLSAISASICGWLADRWVAAGGTPTLVRKTFVASGAAGVGIFLAGSVVASGTLSLVFLMLAGFSFGLSSSNFWVITQRLAGPEAAGRWTGIQNFFGNLAGAVVPAVTGFLLDRTGRFLLPVLIVSLFLWLAALCWILVVGPIEPVEWGRGDPSLVAEPSAYPV